MRDKIKQLLNKEEGFTLIELLGVIVILGLIIAIAIPSIGGIIKKAEVSTNDAQNELIIDAAQLYWVANNVEEVSGTTISIDTLVKEGFLNRAEFPEEDNRVVEVTKEDTTGTEYEVTDVK